MDLQQTESISKDDGERPEGFEDGAEMNVDGWNVESQNQEQASSGPALPNLSRCAACYNHKKSFLHGGDGESSSSAGDSGPEVDWESEAESISSSSSSSVEEDEPQKPSSAAGSEGGGKGDEEEDEGKMLASLAEGTTQADPQGTPASSVPHLRPSSRPDTVVSTLHLQVLTQEHASDTFYIIRQQEEKTEEHGGEQGGACLLPPRTGWSHPPSQQHQLSHQQQQQHLHPYQMFPQHFPLFPVQGPRLPPALHTPPVLHWPWLHRWPQAPGAAQAHLGAQGPHQCWCCSTRAFPPFGHQNKYSG